MATRPRTSPRPSGGQLRILFIGQAVERKGLPILLRAFEALREQIPATLTLVGASAEEVAHMMLDDRGVHALGKVSEERKLAELARAEVLCAPSLHGESFGMVLTEAFAAATPVLASDIPGYRDVVRDGLDGLLVPPGDALALAEALRGLALDPALRARMARSRARARRALRLAARRRRSARLLRAGLRVGATAASAGGRLTRTAVRHGLAPADLLPRVPAERLPSLIPAGPPARRAGRGACARCAAPVSPRARSPAPRSPRSRCNASASPASPPRCSRPSPACSPPASR